MTHRPGTTMLAAILLCTTPQSPQPASEPPTSRVFLRGEREPTPGGVEHVSIEGVAVHEPGSAPASIRLIGWDRIRSVTGDHSTEAGEFAPVLDRAWRARSRLERSDFAGAEPLYDELFARYRGITGPTAAAVDEGLMRCRLARGSAGTAIWPWLSLVATIRQAGAGRAQTWIGGTIDGQASASWPVSRSLRSSVRDEATDLVGAVPPMFVPDKPTAALVASPEWNAYAKGEPTAAELAALYRAAAAFEVSPGSAAGAVSLQPRGQADHAGIRLVAEVVAARVGDKEQRRAARALLEQRIRSVMAAASNADAPAKEPPWVEGWCRAAIGRSLLREDDPKERRRGVTEMLHVPARFADALPDLAALVLAESAAAMRDLGDNDSAAILVRELRARFPGHPVLEWDQLDGIAGPAPAEKSDPGDSPTPTARVRPDQ